MGPMLGVDEGPVVPVVGKADGSTVGAGLGAGGRDANSAEEVWAKVGSSVPEVASEGGSVADWATMKGHIVGCSEGALDGSREGGNEGEFEGRADDGLGDGALVFVTVGVIVIASRGTGVGMVMGPVVLACVSGGCSEGAAVSGPTLGFVVCTEDGSCGCNGDDSCTGSGVGIGSSFLGSSLGAEVVGIADCTLPIADGRCVGVVVGPAEG